MPPKGAKKQPDGTFKVVNPPQGEKSAKSGTLVTNSASNGQSVTPKEQTTVYDTEIWSRLGSYSPKQIADELGLTPTFVVGRVKELLEAVDALTIEQQISQAMVRLNQIAADAQKAAENTIDEYKAGMWNSAISAHAKVLDQLARLKRQNDGALEVLNRKRVQALLQLVDRATMATFEEISATHGVDFYEMTEMFSEKLGEVARELDGE